MPGHHFADGIVSAPGNQLQLRNEARAKAMLVRKFHQLPQFANFPRHELTTGESVLKEASLFQPPPLIVDGRRRFIRDAQLWQRLSLHNDLLQEAIDLFFGPALARHNGDLRCEMGRWRREALAGATVSLFDVRRPKKVSGRWIAYIFSTEFPRNCDKKEVSNLSIYSHRECMS
jgi:hypothetical protein